MVKFFQAKVFHKRINPHNAFCYKSGYILLPLIGTYPKRWFFSVDKFNIFSFYNKDHRKRDGSLTIAWVYERLAEAGLDKNAIKEVMLLTHPRCFGFVFNPVSFYFCLDENQKPLAIIAEVNNTFSQTHSYIIHEDNIAPISSNKIYKTKKEFFVSPFFQTEGHYEFRFFYQERKLAIFINYFKENEIAFETSLIGKILDFTAKNSLPYLLTTFKTVVLIGFQAFILRFIKKLKFRKAPMQSNKKHTINIL